MEKYKLMRMLCMFDLPVDTEGQKGHTGYLEKILFRKAL